jgi:hypothetical protein
LSFQSYWTRYDGKYDFYQMSYDNLSSVSQNVLKLYQQLTGEERMAPFISVGTISNVLVMEIGWTDVGSGGYILVTTQVIIRHMVKILFSVISSPITLERQK